MIFAIAGTQLPFPRLMNTMDELAGRLEFNVLAQTADTQFTSKTMRTVAFLPEAEFDEALAQTRLIVAHAGIGVIMAAAEMNKPIIIMPRRADLGEHRNDHQIATAHRFASVPGITVVESREELEQALLARDHQPVEFGRRENLTNLISAVARTIG